MFYHYIIYLSIHIFPRDKHTIYQVKHYFCKEFLDWVSWKNDYIFFKDAKS